MPCWELFEAQPPEYRDEVLPPDVRARLAVEPGVALGWHKWVGDAGDVVSLERFGASAPGNEVLERLGYNVENVVARAAALLARVS
jgi:transketolase